MAIKRMVLFSKPDDELKPRLAPFIFPLEIIDKRVAYLSANGADPDNSENDNWWKTFCEANNCDFAHVDTSLDPELTKAQIAKLEDRNIMIVSSSNVFRFMKEIASTQIKQAILDFAEKDEFVIAAHGPTAIAMGISIKIAEVVGYNANSVELKDYRGLGLIDTEVYPGFDYSQNNDELSGYLASSKHEVTTLSDEEFLEVSF